MTTIGKSATDARRVSYLLSGESRLEDIRALFHSYGIEVAINGLVYFRAPLFFLDIRTENTDCGDPWAIMNPAIEIKLIHFVPTPDEGEASHERWPFCVNDPLVIHRQFGDQWAQYTFTPGKTYQERSIA